METINLLLVSKNENCIGAGRVNKFDDDTHIDEDQRGAWGDDAGGTFAEEIDITQEHLCGDYSLHAFETQEELEQEIIGRRETYRNMDGGGGAFQRRITEGFADYL